MDQTVQFLNTQFSSVTLNELATKANEGMPIKKTDINPNGVQILKTCLEYMGLNI